MTNEPEAYIAEFTSTAVDFCALVPVDPSTVAAAGAGVEGGSSSLGLAQAPSESPEMRGAGTLAVWASV